MQISGGLARVDLVGPSSGQLLAKVADLRPAEVHRRDLPVHGQYLDRPGRSERCRADFRHAVQEIVAACEDLDTSVGKSDQAEGASGVDRGRLAGVAVVGDRDPQPRRVCNPEELRVVGQTGEP